MANKKTRKKQKCSSKKIVISLMFILVAIFLLLPLVFSETSTDNQEYNSASKALPLTTQNPFASYLKLLKNFYTPGKANRQNRQFTKVNRNSFSKQKDKQDVFLDEETQPTLAQAQNSVEKQSDADYYANQENANPQFYPPLEEQKQGIAEQEPFDDILMEGLYETSHTDPYEVKRAARRTLFDIFSPKRHFAMFNPHIMQENISEINSNNKNQRDFISSDALKQPLPNYLDTNTQNYNSYNYGRLDSFNQNNQIWDKINLSNLPFEEQVNLVASRLNAINSANQQQARANNNNSSNNNQKPPLPPGKKDSFDPSKWSPEVNHGSCNTNEKQNTEEEKPQTKRSEEKIEICDKEMYKKLKRITPKMQKDYNYFIVSGRHQGRIMIPANGSLPETVLTTFSSDEYGIEILNMPKQLRGKKLLQNTEKTEFEFAFALKPQVFKELMKDEKTILLSVDQEDLQRFPGKTILIQSGQIETYPGANQIAEKINGFLANQEKIKKEAQKLEQEDKKQKAKDLDNRIASVI